MTGYPEHLHSADELARAPGLERCELVAGVLRISEPPGGCHGQVAARLAYRLQGFVEAHQLGVVVIEAGFILRRGPDTVRGPDLAFVASPRCPGGRVPEGFFGFAPDLAVEIRSPRDPLADLDEKAADYLAAGTRLVWIVDPSGCRAVVHRPGAEVSRVAADEWLDGGDVLPGFRCLLSEVLPPR